MQKSEYPYSVGTQLVPSPASIHGVFVHRLLPRAPWRDDIYGDELNSTNHLFIVKQIQRCEIECPNKQMTVNSIKRGSLFSFKTSAVCAPKKICVLRPPGPGFSPKLRPAPRKMRQELSEPASTRLGHPS